MQFILFKWYADVCSLFMSIFDKGYMFDSIHPPISYQLIKNRLDIKQMCTLTFVNNIFCFVNWINLIVNIDNIYISHLIEININDVKQMKEKCMLPRRRPYRKLQFCPLQNHFRELLFIETRQERALIPRDSLIITRHPATSLPRPSLTKINLHNQFCTLFVLVWSVFCSLV